ncbi:glycerol-3-phosphate dehydrogenase/oxidase [Corynebacterium glyciniphilum]|uniref:glycerol-3-phosphate dehydrogenase/oxidase n=1 Tax=Corynebacterium glyciniphilum TaxID=1404244 RepID=UPI0026570870|nr:glycerol-3-phosphate dehydrogenase/oxidase [Corynebacterium glyciniphilum]MDN6707162.1 glycerol-3-phosphate dehydrogenase/oxidase [Corynebacterium glyciniphilum]
MPHFNADAARLNATRRAHELDGLRTGSDSSDQNAHVDLVVIGAGVTGAGVALDAATRGLDVLIVDAHDIAFGTSRWSSKLAHGGLRYLATGNVGIARRSALERGILMGTTAPHLTHAVTQVVPVQDRYTPGQKTAPRVGFIAGDALRIAARTPSSTLPPSRTVSRQRVAELCPAVDTSDLRFGYVNHDGQLVDDARLVTALVRTAAGYGARVLTHCRAVEAHGNRVVLQDGLDATSSPVTVTAGAVVNATGVWAGHLDPQVTVRPSRGTHLVIDAAAVGNPTGALTVPVPGHSSRFCFILPEQLGRCYIGITDEDLGTDTIPDVPEVPDSDVQWILDVVNQALAVDLTTDDVLGAFAGLRPLVQFNDSAEGSTADLSREHVILTGEGENANLITVTGGKLTEYRLMAEQTVDLVAEKLRDTGSTPGPCLTTSLPLAGAPGAPGVEDVRPSDLAGLPTSMIDRFGHEAPAVLRTCPVDRPLEPVAPGIDTVRAEFAWHVTHEAALTVEDLIDRRSRIGLVDADREACLAAAQEILDAVG